MNTKLVSVDGVIIHDPRPRRWWHRVIWWKRPRAVFLAAGPRGPLGQCGALTITWDSGGIFRLEPPPRGPGQ